MDQGWRENDSEQKKEEESLKIDREIEKKHEKTVCGGIRIRKKDDLVQGKKVKI